ncbi:MAG: flagellar hook-length control protein FliK [Tindallia sp. MSAO_Bac2]|nr:MAG: flagellar hook-length control protein FliK [Tindallia sp. MSAO_Bac2]
MDISMIKQIRFASGAQDKRAFPETGRIENNNFEKWLQRSQPSATERGSKRSERPDNNNAAITRQSTESKEQIKKDLTEKDLTKKDLKKMTKALDLISDGSIEEIDLTALLKMLEDDQLVKLLEMLGEDFAEKVILFTEMLDLFREIEMTGEKPEIETLEKLMNLMSEKLEAVTVNSEKTEMDSELKNFLQLLTEQTNKLQDQLATEKLDNDKLQALLSDGSLKKSDSKESVVSKEKDTDYSSKVLEIKDTKTPKGANNEPEMQFGKENEDSKGKDEMLSMAEKIMVNSDVKVDAEVMMPFQEIEALLEKNLQLAEEVKMEKTELHQRVMEDLVTNISMIHEKGESRVHMQLIPEHLGKLIIQLTNQDGNMTARIFAETSYARDMIENNFDQLKEALSSKGVNITQLEVFVGKDPEAYEKQREFQYQMNKGKRKRASIEDEGSAGQVVGKINPSVISTNPYLSVEGFDQLG